MTVRDEEPPGPDAEPARPVSYVDPRTSRFAAMRRGLCPRCRAGRIFPERARGVRTSVCGLRSRFRMNERCPSCGLRFEREPGYFTGALYISYALAVPIIGLFTVLLWFGPLRGRELEWAVLPAGALFLPLVPSVFRYSRIVWIHMDRYIDP